MDNAIDLLAVLPLLAFLAYGMRQANKRARNGCHRPGSEIDPSTKE